MSQELICQNCKYYFYPDSKTYAGPQVTYPEMRVCRRYPEMAPISPLYWCGEFVAARVAHD